jgi:hypothetical protein
MIIGIEITPRSLMLGSLKSMINLCLNLFFLTNASKNIHWKTDANNVPMDKIYTLLFELIIIARIIVIFKGIAIKPGAT